MKVCPWCGGNVTSSRATYCGVRCRVAAFRERRRMLQPAGPRNVSAPAASRAVTVAALYVRRDGPYFELPGVDPWDVDRDATRWDGPGPCIAHPPCAPWGRFRKMMHSRQRADLAVRAVDQVRWHGGILEHPAGSHLWRAMELPGPGQGRDRWGGWTKLVRQAWWGHRAPKPTWLYIVGRVDMPETPLPVAWSSCNGRVENMGRRERELTPPKLARYLVGAARGCNAMVRQ